MNTNVPITSMQTDARRAFESLCKFAGYEYRLEWDAAGFYEDINTDVAFTWFERGFDLAKQGLDAQVLNNSFREYLVVSEHIDASGHAMDSIATDLTRIVLAEVKVSAVISRRKHCNASGQAGEDGANIRAAALACAVRAEVQK